MSAGHTSLLLLLLFGLVLSVSAGLTSQQGEIVTAVSYFALSTAYKLHPFFIPSTNQRPIFHPIYLNFAHIALLPLLLALSLLNSCQSLLLHASRSPQSL